MTRYANRIYRSSRPPSAAIQPKNSTPNARSEHDAEALRRFSANSSASGLTPEHVLQLQQTVGNRAAQRYLSARRVQRQPDAGLSSDAELHTAAQRLQGLDAPDEARTLPTSVRDGMAGYFETDLSGVQVFEGGSAAQSNALAYAQNDAVHFAPGQFDPTSADGLNLIGHEMTHIAQQRQGDRTTRQGKRSAQQTTNRLEAEADHFGTLAAQAVTSGRRAAAVPALSAVSANAAQFKTVGQFNYDSSTDKDEPLIEGKLKLLAEKTDKMKAQLETIDLQLVNGGDQTALEKKSRAHYEDRQGQGRPSVPADEVFQGNVPQQQAESENFASKLDPLKGGDTSQYNLWSGMGKKGEKKENTPRGQAEATPGFVMQQTKDFAKAIWEVRNVAGFIDSENNWPWDPNYHLAMARWLEAEQNRMLEEGTAANKAWPSEAAIGKKLDELRSTDKNSDSRVKVVNDFDRKRGTMGELVGYNRKIGDSIFEAPSANLASRIGKSMVPVQSFGLEVHENPKATVQWQVEIPNVIKQAEALQQEFNAIATLCKELAAIASDLAIKQQLGADAEALQHGAIQYKTGARALKMAIDKNFSVEWWKTQLGWTNAELMQSGRELVLGALTRTVALIQKLGIT